MYLKDYTSLQTYSFLILIKRLKTNLNIEFNVYEASTNHTVGQPKRSYCLGITHRNLLYGQLRLVALGLENVCIM